MLATVNQKRLLAINSRLCMMMVSDKFVSVGNLGRRSSESRPTIARATRSTRACCDGKLGNPSYRAVSELGICSIQQL